MLSRTCLLLITIVFSNAIFAVDVHFLSSTDSTVSFMVAGDYALGDNDTKTQARKVLLEKIKRATIDNYGQLVESSREWKNQAVTSSTVSILSAQILNVREVFESVKVDESGRMIFMISATIDINISSLQKEVDELRGVRLKHLIELRNKRTISFKELSDMKANLQVALSTTARLEQTHDILNERRNILGYLEKVSNHLSALPSKTPPGYSSQLDNIQQEHEELNILQGSFEKAVMDYELNHFRILELEENALNYSISKMKITKSGEGLYELTALLGWTPNPKVYALDNRQYFEDKVEMVETGGKAYTVYTMTGNNRKVPYNSMLVEYFEGRNSYVVFEYGSHKFEYVFTKGASFEQYMYTYKGEKADVFGKSNFIRITGLTESDIRNNGEIKGHVELRNESS